MTKKSKYKNPNGYIMIYKPDHTRTWFGYVQEDILIMEEHLGILLPDGCHVHHRNKIRDDNRIENLLLMRNESDHVMLHHFLKANNQKMIDTYESWSLELMKNIKNGMPYSEAVKHPFPSNTLPKTQDLNPEKPKTILRKKIG